MTGAIAAETAVHYYYPNNDTIAGATLTLYLNGTAYANNTAIDWGACKAGNTYTKNLTIANFGGVTLNVTITTQNLPAEWTLTWQANNTRLEPDYEVVGWLNLTIPATATTWPTWGFSLNGETA